MIRTPLCDLLGIEYPVFQGGMAWIADGKLVLTMGSMPEGLRAEIITNGISFFCRSFKARSVLGVIS